MEAVLSPDFTDNVLNLIYSHHRARVEHLVRDNKRMAVLSDSRFTFPFQNTVVHGMYSGEWQEGFICRRMRRGSGYRSAQETFGPDSEDPLLFRQFDVRVKDVVGAIRDLFNVSYGLGSDFHGISELRDERGRIQKIPEEQGLTFVDIMVNDKLFMDEESRDVFVRDVWRGYANPMPPRFYFG